MTQNQYKHFLNLLRKYEKAVRHHESMGIFAEEHDEPKRDKKQLVNYIHHFVTYDKRTNKEQETIRTLQS